MIVLWGRATSINVQKAMWALAEAGTACERVDVGGKHGGLDTPAYGTKNPNRLIPTIEIDGMTLWESTAILRYVAASRGKGTIWPADIKMRAVADQWVDWSLTTFQPGWIDLFVETVRVPPERQNRAAIEKARTKAIGVFGMLDDRLAEAAYVAGPQFSYADIALGTSLHRWLSMDFDRPALRHVAAWHARLMQRPHFAPIVHVSYADLYGTA